MTLQFLKAGLLLRTGLALKNLCRAFIRAEAISHPWQFVESQASLIAWGLL